jgi:hypothetical protein
MSATGSLAVPGPLSAPPATPTEPEIPRGETVMISREAIPTTASGEFGTVALVKPKFIEEQEGGVLGTPLTLGAVTSIGRTPDNDISLDVREVSRKHARIELRDDGSFVLLDLGSGNGTFVNEERVQERRLEDGDRVRFGNRVFIYRV